MEADYKVKTRNEPYQIMKDDTTVINPPDYPFAVHDSTQLHTDAIWNRQLQLPAYSDIGAEGRKWPYGKVLYDNLCLFWQAVTYSGNDDDYSKRGITWIELCIWYQVIIGWPFSSNNY